MVNNENNVKKPIYFGSFPEKKYVVVPSLDTLPYDKKDYAKSAVEIEDKVNTESVLRKISILFNDLTFFMARNGIEFDQLSISTITGIVASDKYYDELKSVLSDSYTETQIKGLYSKLKEETYEDVVPVDFKVDLQLTGKNDNGIDYDKLSKDIKTKLNEFKVSGLVHFDQFMVGLRDLGFNVNSTDRELLFYDDYLDMIKENDGYGTWFSVEVYYHNRKAQGDEIKL